MDQGAAAAAPPICCDLVSDVGKPGKKFQKRHLLDVDQETPCQAHPWPACPYAAQRI
jgi:hypothetical protein